MKKKVSIIICAIAMAITTSSCSKAYNCHCVYKTDGAITHEDDSKVNEGKKEKSAKACDQGDNTTTSTLGGNTYVNTTECELT